jgi:hypothetical protein
MATRVTFEGCSFDQAASPLATFSLPALRALTVVDCANDHALFRNLHGHDVPQLRALMVKHCQCSLHRGLGDFLRRIVPLRELILQAQDVTFEHQATIARHAGSLEVFSVRSINSGFERHAFDMLHLDLKALLMSLTAIRHLGCLVNGFIFIDSNGNRNHSKQELQPFMVKPTR